MVVQRVILAGLLATIGLATFDTEAQARHCCRRSRCCNSGWTGGYQQTAFQQGTPINTCAYQSPYGNAQMNGQIQPYQDGQLNQQGQFQQGQLNAQGQFQGQQQAPQPPREGQNAPAPQGQNAPPPAPTPQP